MESVVPAVTGRLSAEIIPWVTVFASPSGEPIASTSSPTLILEESPSAIAGKLPFFTCKTAMSYMRSRPTIVAAISLPSANSTLIVPLVAAASTTWLLVMM